MKTALVSITARRQFAQAKLWIALNLLDVALSSTGVQLGAFEVNIVAQVLGNSWGFFLYKLLLALATLAILSRLGKTHLLRYLNIGMVAVCLWYTMAILLSVTHL